MTPLMTSSMFIELFTLTCFVRILSKSIFSNSFLDNLNVSVPEDLRVELESSLELFEIDAAVRSMANGKRPGEDSLPKEFYICFLDLIGPDLLDVFNCAFKVNSLSISQRMGIITLLDKQGDPLDPQNKRPISLLNVDYKILSKVFLF